MATTLNINNWNLKCQHCGQLHPKTVVQYYQGNEFELHTCMKCKNLTLIRFPVAEGDEIATLFKCE